MDAVQMAKDVSEQDQQDQQDQQDPDQDSRPWMDSLPDELLLLILSCIKDGVTLLDGVSLVCRRWRRVVQDPRAWASVQVLEPVAVDGGGEWSPRRELLREKQMTDLARVFLHAPALGRVCIGGNSTPSKLYNARPLSAVRRCKATVREFRLSMPATLRRCDQPYVSELLALLRRRCGDVRALTLAHYPLVPDRPVASLLGLLRLLPWLERLDIRLEMHRSVSYGGELGAMRLPCLMQLVIRLQVEYDEYDGSEQSGLTPHQSALLVDLVGGASATLRCLEFDRGYSRWSLRPSLCEAVSRCRALRRAALPLVDAAAVVGLPHLHTLRLDLFPWAFGPEDVETALFATGADALLAAPDSHQPLPSLHHLTISVLFYSKATAWLDANAAVLGALFRGVGRLAANAVCLRLGFSGAGFPPEVPVELLRGMTHLQAVELTLAPVECLAPLAGLASLRRLSGEVVAAGGLLDKSASALEEFRRQRPDVDTERLSAVIY